MSISTSRGSYKDCFDVWKAALDDAEGARVKMTDFDAANHFRMRMHTARAIDRRDNKEIYEQGDKMHGASIYDPLVVRIKNEEGEFYVYVEHVGNSLGKIERLSSKEDDASDEAVVEEAPDSEQEVVSSGRRV